MSERYPIKLVRDRIKDVPNVHGGEVKIFAVGHTTHVELLRKKLLEEVAEYLVDGGGGELADILEVVESLGNVAEGENFKHLRARQLDKRRERGGFARGHVMYAYPAPSNEPSTSGGGPDAA